MTELERLLSGAIPENIEDLIGTEIKKRVKLELRNIVTQEIGRIKANFCKNMDELQVELFKQIAAGSLPDRVMYKVAVDENDNLSIIGTEYIP